MIERITKYPSRSFSIWTKLNPLWWLTGPDGWTAPEINTSKGVTEPYLPGIQNQLLRNLIWWTRNPAMNLVGYVLGVEDQQYDAVGPIPVMATTGRDIIPVWTGWRWAYLSSQVALGWYLLSIAAAALYFTSSWWWAALWLFATFKGCGIMPYVSYYGPVEFYLGWRPYSGGFGFKLVPGTNAWAVWVVWAIIAAAIGVWIFL